jgi:hypothetical protein
MDLAKLGFEVNPKGLIRGQKELEKLDKAGARAEKTGNALGVSFKSLVGVFSGLGIVALARDTFKAASSMQTMGASLKTVMGSASAASGALSEIKEFAKTTPFDLEQSVQGFIKLKALGLDPSIEALRSYGNTASAMGKSLNQAVEAVADAATGEFERLKEFGIKAKSQGDLVTFTFQGVATTVKKEASAIEGYLQGIGNNNFGSAMSDQMDTLGAQTSNLRGAFFELQLAFFNVKDSGQGLANSAGNSIKLLTRILKSDGAIAAVQSLGSAFSAVIDSLILTVSALNTIRPAILPALTAFAAVKASIAVWTALSAAVAGSSLTLSMFTTRAGLATVASASMTGAVGLLRGAMSLLGGPVGAIALVVGALAIFISKSKQAKNANNDFIASINAGNNAMTLNDKLFKTSEILKGLESDLSNAEAQLISSNKATGLFASGSINASVSIKRLKSEIEQAKTASENIKKQIEEQEKQTKLLSDSTNDAGDSFSSLTGVIGENTTTVITNKSAFKGATKLMDSYVGSIQDLINKSRDAANVFGEYNSAAETVDAAILQNIKTGVRYDKVLEELHKRFPEGTRGSKEYKEAIKTLGLETEKTTTVMSEYWERFANGAFDSFKTFTKSAFTDFKSFGDSLKNLAKDIVSDLIATFASNKLKDIFKNLFSGGEGASSGGFLDSIKDVFGGGSDSGVSGIFKSLFGGTTSEVGPTQPGAISGLFASGGLFSSTGKIGGLFAKGGLFGSGGSMAESFASLTELINPYTAAIAAVIAMGGPLISKIFKSGARSPQQLGEDQLAAVDMATKEGRNTQVGLGQAGSTALSFLGGFDENSIFFGVDLAKEQLQKVGDVFREMTGANQALALKDGVIRIEDFNTKFSRDHEKIVAQLKASIIQVELGITDSEKSIISSIGGSLVELDTLFDASAGNGETTAMRLAESYATAFETTTKAGQDWVASSGIDADRIAQIFNASSNNVIASLFGISDVGTEVFNKLASSSQGFASSIPRISANTGERQTASNSNQASNNASNRNAKDISFLANQVSRFVDSATSSNIQQQPMYGT